MLDGNYLLLLGFNSSGIFAYEKNIEIAHNDIKCENFVFDKEFDIKLIDFGLATTTKFISSDWNTGRKELMKLAFLIT